MTKVGPEEAGEATDEAPPETKAPSRGTSLLDFGMRIVAAIAILGSTIAVVTTNRTLPSFKEFVSFRVQYSDLPAFRFFVVANAIVCAYLVLSLALSIFHILKSTARLTRSVLIILDMVMLALLTAGASAAAAIVYVAHNGDSQANWSAICQQFSSFCGRVSGSLVGSFMGILILMLLISLTSIDLSRN